LEAYLGLLLVEGFVELAALDVDHVVGHAERIA